MKYSQHNKKTYDVYFLCEPIVDYIVHVKTNEISKLTLSETKKTSAEEIKKILKEKEGEYTISAGGSEANVAANLASLGLKNILVSGVLKNDKDGQLFIKSLKEVGVRFLSHYAEGTDHQTAHCIAFVTDQERTFFIYSDITEIIDDSFIDYEALKNSRMFYTDAANINGSKSNKSKVLMKVLNIAKPNRVVTVFNLNNNNFVSRHRDEIKTILEHIDIVIGGEKEFKNLFEVNELLEVTKNPMLLRKIVVITRGREGALIVNNEEEMHFSSAIDKNKFVNVIGAGDGFAAGFLYALLNNANIADAGRIASETAEQIIYRESGRPSPDQPLKELVNLVLDQRDGFRPLLESILKNQR